MNRGMALRQILTGFTHVDPFEDTESAVLRRREHPALLRFTHVDPFEDTERIGAAHRHPAGRRFTHVDPFEDTERNSTRW